MAEHTPPVAALGHRSASASVLNSNVVDRRMSLDELGIGPLMTPSSSAAFPLGGAAAMRTASFMVSGSGVSTSGAAGPQLITTTLDHGRLTIDNAVLNDTHTLKQFGVKSLATTPVLVRLQTNLGNQLGFQLTNENIQDGVVVPPSVYNELFNIVNLIDSFVLEPGETKNVIVTFLPETYQQDAPLADRYASEETYKAFEISGKIFLSASSLGAASNGTVVQSPPDAPTAADAIAEEEQQQLVLRFRSTVCRSVLRLDPSELEISFDDCVLGGLYVKDVTVYNRSEIPLSFCVNRAAAREGDHVLDFSEYDTGYSSQQYDVAGFGHARIRIAFRPQEVGEFDLSVQFENLRDASNVETIAVHVAVTAERRVEAISVSGGGALDFGDCYTGETVVRMLTLRNLTESPVDVDFRQGRPLEVTVHVATDANDGVPADVSETSSVGFGTAASHSSPSPTVSALRRPATGSNGAEVRAEGGNLQIDQFTLPAGRERTVVVRYSPVRAAGMSDDRAARLTRQSLRLHLRCFDTEGREMERRLVQLRARVCTSIIRLEKSELNFGEINVGTVKTSTFRVVNESDLPAHVRLMVQSKILAAPQDVVVIGPRQAWDARVDMCPRKVNPDYRKQLTVANIRNRDNDLILVVRSNNMDQNGATFHSLFYVVQTASARNFLNFDTLVYNDPKMRTFTVKNVSGAPLTLELSSSSEQLKMYVRSDASSSQRSSVTSRPAFRDESAQLAAAAAQHAASAEMREKLIESMEERNRARDVQASVAQSSAGSTGAGAAAPAPDVPMTGYLDLATAKARSRPITRHNSLDVFMPLPPSAPSARGRDNKQAPQQQPSQVSSSQVSTGLPPSWDLDGAARMQRRLADDAVGSGPGSPLMATALPSVDPSYPASSSGGPQSHVPSVLSANSSTSVAGVLSSHAASPSPTFGHQDSIPVTAPPSAALSSDGAGVFASVGAGGNSAPPMPLEELARSYEELTNVPNFTDPLLEEEYIRTHQRRRRELERAIAERRIVPVTRLHLAAESRTTVYVVFTAAAGPIARSRHGGKMRNREERIVLRLLESRLADDVQGGDVLPTREILVRAKACQSVIEVGQKNINFGTLKTSEFRAKSLLLTNSSEVPMLYKLRKTGSISSSDLHINEGRMGVVRAYGNREINFVFRPSLHGAFYETLFVENVQDPENSLVIHLKARVRKPPTFYLKSLTLDFGPVVAHELTAAHSISLTNTGSKRRSYEIRAVFPATKADGSATAVYAPEFSFELDSSMDGVKLSRESEEAIEQLEQKIKIAERKGQTDKADKIRDKLAKLRAGELDGGESAYTSEASDDEAMSDAGKPARLERRVKRSGNSIVFSVDPYRVQRVLVRMHPASDSVARPRRESITGTLAVHAHRDVDVIKQITYSAVVCEDYETYLDAMAEVGPGDGVPPDAIAMVERGAASPGPHPHPHPHPHSHYRPRPRESSLGVERSASAGQSHGAPTAAARPPSLPPVASAVASAEAERRPMSPASKIKAAFMNTVRPMGRGFGLGAFTQSRRGGAPDAPAVMPPPSSSSPTRKGDEQLRFTVSPSELDLGDVLVSEEAPGAFDVSNARPQPMLFVLMEQPPPQPQQGTATATAPSSPSISAGTVAGDAASAQGTQQAARAPKSIRFEGDTSGQIHARAVLRVPFKVRFAVPGRHRREIVIRDLVTRQEEVVVVTANARRPRYLRFPDLETAGETREGAVGDIKLGECYIVQGQRFAKVCPVRVENVSRAPIFLSCKSNLAKQVFVMCDERLEVPADDVRIDAGQSAVVRVCLQPHVPEESLATGECRELIGGIRFEVYDGSRGDAAQATQPTLLVEATARFSATVGQSILKLSDAILKLGSTTVVGQKFSGKFSVRNLSTLLSAEYRVHPPPGMTVSPLGGQLRGRESQASGEWEHVVQFECVSEHFGLYNERIRVENLANPAQDLDVIVRFFVDEDCLHTDLPRGETVIRVLDFGDIYLSPCGNGRWSVGFQSIENPRGLNIRSSPVWPSRTFRIHNTLSIPVRLRPKTDLDLSVHWVHLRADGSMVAVGNRRLTQSGSYDGTEDAAAMHDLDDDSEGFGSGDSSILPAPSLDDSLTSTEEIRVCGGEYVLPGKGSIGVCISFPAPIRMSARKWRSLNEGKRVNYFGMLLFERLGSGALNTAALRAQALSPGGRAFLFDARVGEVVKVVDLACMYCLSLGSVSPSVVDVGRVGYFNSWRRVRFEFTVENRSEVPLLYRFGDMHPALSVYQGEKLQAAVDPLLYFALEPLQSKLFRGELDPLWLDRGASGPQRLSLELANVNNASNKMAIAITAQLTVFELRFDRLPEGNAVALPALVFPAPAAPASACEEWFTVENRGTSEELVKFVISVEVDPAVAPFVSIEVLSRSSNRPLSEMSLGQGETMDVRVRGSLIPNARPPEALCGLGPSSVTLGRISFRSVHPDISEELPSETIYVRGSIEAKPIFALSANTIKLFVKPAPSLLPSFTPEVAAIDEESIEGQDGMGLGRNDSADAEIEALGMLAPSPAPSAATAGPLPDTQVLCITNLSSGIPFRFCVSLRRSDKAGQPQPASLAASSGSVTNQQGASSVFSSVPQSPLMSQASAVAPLSMPSSTDKAPSHAVPHSPLTPPPYAPGGPFDEALRAAGALQSLQSQQSQTAQSAQSVAELESPFPVSFHPREGCVEPGGTVEVEVQLARLPEIDTCTAFLVVTDLDAPSPALAERIVKVDVIAGASGESVAPSLRTMRPVSGLKMPINASLSGDGASAFSGILSPPAVPLEEAPPGFVGAPAALPSSSDLKYPVIVLRGCMQVQPPCGTSVAAMGCGEEGGVGQTYEVNLGQQNVGSGSVQWELSLENPHREQRIDYRVYPLRQDNDDASWLSLSRTDGSLDPYSSHKVVLTLSAARQAVLFTYLIVENVNVPTDLKSVRVMMEVVSSKGPAGGAPDALFKVIAEGVEGDRLFINMGEVYHGHTYRNRSILVRNTSSMPLDFLLSSNLTPADRSELNFSLSRDMAKLFRTLTIDAESTVRVFLHFCPRRDVDPDADAELQDAERLAEDSQPGSVHKIVEIYINCRLVKNYQKVVTLSAICLAPQIEIVEGAVFFRGYFQGTPIEGSTALVDEGIVFEPAEAKFVMRNMVNTELRYVLRNDSQFFEIEGVDGRVDGLVEGTRGATCEVIVRLRRDVILANLKQLLQERYMQEHVGVCNALRPTEKHRLPMHISLGYLVKFVRTPSPRTHALAVLECHVLSVLGRFKAHLSAEYLRLYDQARRRVEAASEETDDAARAGAAAIADFDLPAELKDVDDAVYLDYVYVVDELVYYGLNSYPGTLFSLAHLLFTTLLGHKVFAVLAPSAMLVRHNRRVWPASLAKWVFGLRMFLSFFPRPHGALAPLRALSTHLVLPEERLAVKPRTGVAKAARPVV